MFAYVFYPPTFFKFVSTSVKIDNVRVLIIAMSLVNPSHINASNNLIITKLPNNYNITIFKPSLQATSDDIHYITPFNNYFSTVYKHRSNLVYIKPNSYFKLLKIICLRNIVIVYVYHIKISKSNLTHLTSILNPISYYSITIT